MRSGKQSREQLGIHGDSEYRMESEIRFALLTAVATGQEQGHRAEKKRLLTMEFRTFLSVFIHVPCQITPPCQENDSLATELELLQPSIVSAVCCSRSVGPKCQKGNVLEKKSFDVESEAKRNRNAKPRSISRYEAIAIEKKSASPLVRSLLRYRIQALTNKLSHILGLVGRFPVIIKASDQNTDTIS